MPKATAAGADSIMAGSLFAGTEEAPAETIIYDGRKFKVPTRHGLYRCNATGSMIYFQDVEDDIKKLVPEGIEGRLPFRGKLSEVMVQYIGGLRACKGCIKSISDLKKARMVRITL
ncbi:MAG: IMP dehydrogenase [Saprospiraceae bacterium]